MARQKRTKRAPAASEQSSSTFTSSATVPEIDARIRNCTLCRLHESRTNAVPGAGSTDKVDLMFVGEGPGRKEDEAGEPFVGAAGKLLNNMLMAAGLERSKVYITNIVKCRPPQNRKPLADEVATCTSNYLQKQIELLNPRLICTLGATALEYFTGEKKMGPVRGKLARTKEGRQIYPTYHPASVFRNRSLKATLEADIKNIRSVLAEL
jgi:uracil-DNA glycosylase